MNPIASKISQLTLKHGTAGLKKILKESAAEKAANGTATDFPEVECRESLIAWSHSEQFLEQFDALKNGHTLDVSNSGALFVHTTEFDVGEETEAIAQRIVIRFFERVVDEIYREEREGLVHLGRRQEVLHEETRKEGQQQHQETQENIRQEIHSAADRMIEAVTEQVTPKQLPLDKAEQEFTRQTRRAISRARIIITGLAESIPREEVARIEDQFRRGVGVVLTGDSGTGKTGIAATSAKLTLEDEKSVLFIDARRVQHIRDESELQRFYSLDEPIISAIERLAQRSGFRLVIDQLDNVIGLPVAAVLIDLAADCSSISTVEVLVISRNREIHESRLLQRLFTVGFVELRSTQLSEGEALTILAQLRITNPSPELLQLSRNLLNLEIIATIKHQNPNFSFTTVFAEVALWETFVHFLQQREEDGSSLKDAEDTVVEAMQLAQRVLSQDEQVLVLDASLPAQHRRLVSWGIIVNIEERIYQFGHEQLQDYLYARDAAGRGAMPQTVLNEIRREKTKSVFAWIEKIYTYRNSVHLERFLEELLNVE